jgi:MFS family permease
MYPVFILAGMGWATINVNSFPMVVELARGGDVGKYTGFYYTASMAAQIVAPILSGVLYDLFGMRATFFAFGTVFVVLSFVTMFFVKHGDAKADAQSALEALAGADD